MNEVFITWKKDGTKITVRRFLCSCGGTMRFVGSAGCSHDSDYTYFYQCGGCKLVEASNICHERYGSSDEDLINAGWKQTKVIKPTK